VRNGDEALAPPTAAVPPSHQGSFVYIGATHRPTKATMHAMRHSR
jgi:hypothetical protein